MQDCCKLRSYSAKKCIRKDKKVFKLPRKFSIKRCKGKIKGFTMRASCAPFKFCSKQKGEMVWKVLWDCCWELLGLPSTIADRARPANCG